MKSNDRIEKSMVRDLLAAVDEEVSARELPASDEQLAQVLEFWKQLPSEWSPNEKAAFLLDSDLPELLREQQSSTTRPCSDFHPHLSEFRQLTAQGLKLPLPLSFHASIQAAAQWTSFMEFLANSQTRQREAVYAAWTWQNPLSQPMHRLAIVRAADELRISNPGLLRKTEPTLGEIRLFRNRINAYQDARLRALNRVRDLVIGLIPKGDEIPRLRRSPPGWTTRNDVEKCYAMAALRALNVCSEEAWAQCLRIEVPRLNVNERRRFEAIHTDDHTLRTGSTLPLQIWLIDNGPLISRFDLKKAAVFGRAGELGLSASQNDSDVSKWDLGFTFRRGRPKPDRKNRVHRLIALLSPRPAFVVDVS